MRNKTFKSTEKLSVSESAQAEKNLFVMALVLSATAIWHLLGGF